MSRIALVTIARNESRCIARCLNSARAWVDEMWLLDTGSADDTVAIAQSCGAKVAHFVWQDDFAAARNAALALTDAPWRLVLDADEWIADAGDAWPRHQAELRAFCSRPVHAIGALIVSSQTDGGAVGAAPAPSMSNSWLPRLLPRGVGYLGRIHEQPDSPLPRQRLGVQLLHDGYLVEHMAAKRGRNRQLLQLALHDDPDDAYMRYQLGKDFELNAEFEAAQAHYEVALSACPAQAGWRHDLLLRHLFSLKKTGRFEQARRLADAEREGARHSPDFHFTVGDLCLDWALAEPQRAAQLLPMIESCWLQAIAIGERPDLQDSVSGRGSWLAAHNLAVFHESLGDVVQARHWRGREQQMRA